MKSGGDMMMKTMIYSLMLFLLSMLLSNPGYSKVTLWDASLIVSDDGIVIMAWDNPNTCSQDMFCASDVELVNMETGRIDFEILVPGKESTMSIDIRKPRRPGYPPQFYMLRVRILECQDPFFSNNCVYSDWATSITHGLIEVGLPAPKAGPWILYWK